MKNTLPSLLHSTLMLALLVSGIAGGSLLPGALPLARAGERVRAEKPDVSAIYGKIQYVTSFPDYKVQVVTAFEDLRVQEVTSFPDKPGKWQIVTSFPDYKIQKVTSFPDFKIRYVNSFPGTDEAGK